MKDSANLQKIINDLITLHNLPDEDTCRIALALFLLKWIGAGEEVSMGKLAGEYIVEGKLGW